MAVVDADLVATGPPADHAPAGGPAAPAAPATAPARETPGDAAPAELRRRMAEDGYVVVRGAIPPPDAAAVRDALVAVLAEAGLVEAGSGAGVRPTERSAGVDVFGEPELFRRLYGLEILHRLPHHPRLLALAGVLLELPEGAELGSELLVHPRPALRAVFPGAPARLAATPPHQDLLGMQGTSDAYTAWVALSDCPREGGVLAVAAGSHRSGLRPFQPCVGARVATCDAGDLADTWVAADLAPGDAVAFHSLTVHRALPNASSLVRLSIDARYQRASDPVCAVTITERSDLPWDRLYAGWSEESAPFRRYWERLPLEVVPFDPSRVARR